ncbi:hypothetical protein [Actinoallomurus bryophytorum]|uniref:hypothetical protein n=1 Tax=Actinoallomurus bryophytorum TaxID=1490222 RepID=UPI001C896C65|nr:hypothetical protein [Actinoallomurus bryophytorum]
MDESEDPKFARAMEHVAHAQPYARWWMAVTDEIEHGGLEAMAALTKVRAAARQALLLPHPTPGDSWFNVAHSHAATEAARRFFRDTALFNLDTITGSESAAPAITGTGVPHAAAAPPHQTTGPTWPPASGHGTPTVGQSHHGPDTPTGNER